MANVSRSALWLAPVSVGLFVFCSFFLPFFVFPPFFVFVRKEVLCLVFFCVGEFPPLSVFLSSFRLFVFVFCHPNFFSSQGLAFSFVLFPVFLFLVSLSSFIPFRLFVVCPSVKGNNPRVSIVPEI